MLIALISISCLAAQRGCIVTGSSLSQKGIWLCCYGLVLRFTSHALQVERGVTAIIKLNE